MKKKLTSKIRIKANKSFIKSTKFHFILGFVVTVAIFSLLHLKQGYGFIAPSVAAESEFAPTDVIIKYKSNVSELQKNNLKLQFNVTRKERIDKLRSEVVKVPEGKVEEFVSKFKNHPLVEFAEPNFQAKISMITNDSALNNQWGLYKIDAADNAGMSAWDVTSGSANVKIAVLDTGIEESHSDISGKVSLSSNFTTSITSSDLKGHGTHVAGIISASTNNSNGIAGVGYNVQLMNGKVLGDDGSGYHSWIANGIIWAADNGTNVINMSLGGPADSLTLKNAVDYATSKGVTIVAAAGNTGTTNPHYPAYYSNIIAVAATDSNDSKASFSTYGSWVDVAAPGVSIYSTVNNNSYAYYSGTSMASPHVAGLAGLILAKGACTTNTCVRMTIESTTDKISGTGTYWIHGRINAYNAVSSTPVNPTPTLTPTPTAIPTSTPTPTPQIQKTLTANSIDMWKNNSRVYARITVFDEQLTKALPSARVYLTITTPSGRNYNSSNSTNSVGQATFNISTREKGIFKSTITNITKSGYIYHPTITTQTLLVQ